MLMHMHCNPELIWTLPVGAVCENPNVWIYCTNKLIDLTTGYLKVHVTSYSNVQAHVWIEQVIMETNVYHMT